MSWEDQREAMFNAWAAKKKWMKVDVNQLDNGQWVAQCEHTFGFLIRDTRQAAIMAMDGFLSERGYEIENRFDLFFAPEKKTFVEWLRLVELKRKFKEGSFIEHIHPSEVNIKMPKGKIIYYP